MSFFSPDLALSEPDWLKEGQRGPDVPARKLANKADQAGHLEFALVARCDAEPITRSTP